MVAPMFKVQHPIIRTCFVEMSWICMGLFSELTGPTVPYLKYRVQCNYEQLSRTLAARSVGYLIGALTGGVLCEKLLKFSDCFLCGSLLLASLSTGGAPYCNHWIILAVCFFMDGIAKGIIGVVGSMIIIRIWMSKATVPNTGLHFAFGIGALISPQIVRPFLTGHGRETSSNAEDFNFTTSSRELINQTESESYLDSPIQYPYLIVSGVTCLNGFILLALYYIDHPNINRQTRNDIDKDDPSLSSTCLHRFHPTVIFGFMGDSKLLLYLLPTTYLIISMISIGEERAYGKFLFSYAVDSAVNFTPETAAILDSVFWASFTAGRGVATVAAYFVSPGIVMAVCAFSNITSITLLSLFGAVYPLMTWIGSAVFGASISPLFPAAMSWINSDIGFSSTAASVSFVSTAVGAFLFSWLAGYLFQYHGPNSLTYMLTVTSSILVVAVIMMSLSIKKVKRQKHERKQMTLTENKNADENNDNDLIKNREITNDKDEEKDKFVQRKELDNTLIDINSTRL